MVAITSAALMLRYSLRMETAASAIESAIERVLKRGVRTADMPGKGRSTTTTRMGDMIVDATRKILKSARKPSRRNLAGQLHGYRRHLV